MINDKIRLTRHQKSVIATILHAAEQEVADDVLASSNNLMGAMQQLRKLKLIANHRDDLYQLTSLGLEYAKDAYIVDDLGELTDEGLGLVIGSDDKPVTESYSFKAFLLK